MHVPPGYTTVFPYIVADNAADYVTFLIDGLGGVEVSRSMREDKIANSQIRFGDTTIMVSDPQLPAYPASRSGLYLYVENADAALARALAQGAKLEMPVADMPYGDRQGGIVDPSGNTWWLSQRPTDAPYD